MFGHTSSQQGLDIFGLQILLPNDPIVSDRRHTIFNANHYWNLVFLWTNYQAVGRILSKSMQCWVPHWKNDHTKPRPTCLCIIHPKIPQCYRTLQQSKMQIAGKSIKRSSLVFVCVSSWTMARSLHHISSIHGLFSMRMMIFVRDFLFRIRFSAHGFIWVNHMTPKLLTFA